MKIKPIYKVFIFLFIGILFIQFLDLSYYLMNRPDSYLSNLGLLTFGTTITTIVFCLYSIIVNFIKFIEEKNK